MEHITRKLRWVWVAVLLTGGFAISSHAVTVRLEGFVTYALDDAGGTPLADGSIVQIVGSVDTRADGFVSFQTTNLLYGTTLGADIILKQIVVDSTTLNSNGTFFTTAFFETTGPTQGDEVYIRFFDFVGTPVTGFVDYGPSAFYSVTNHPGVQVFVDFAPTTELQTNLDDNFIAIPEPGTSHLVLLFSWMLFWFSGRRRRRSPVGVFRRMTMARSEPRLPPDY